MESKLATDSAAPRNPGLLLGYAATPEDEIEAAVVRLQGALEGICGPG